MTSSADNVRIPRWALASAALVAGVLLSGAFAPVSAWPAAFASVAVFDQVVRRAFRVRQAVGFGALFGLGVLVPSTAWQLLLTVEAYVGLIATELPFYMLLGLGLFLVNRGPASVVWSAGVWVLVESAFSSWPFGGFPWLRLGYVTVDSPLVGLLSLVGVGAVSGVVALVGGLIGRAVTTWTPQSIGVLIATLAVVVAGTLGLPSILDREEPRETVKVGWVQGGIHENGIYGIGDPRTTTNAHYAELAALMEKVESGAQPRPDFVVGPENTTDMDPASDLETRRLVTGMVRRSGVPVLIGTPLVGDRVGERRTAAVWWTESGPKTSYDKRHLVPMGEWVPFRDFFLPLFPDLAYVGDQSVAGDTPGVLPVTLPNGRNVSIGVAICYDIAYADSMRDAVTAGAQVLVVQSNNAMFAGSAQLEQQWVITRARAAEVRRPILVVTTSGVSGLIDSDGRSIMRAPQDQAASGVESMAMLTGVTPFVSGGWLAEPLLSWATFAWIGVLAATRFGLVRKNRRASAVDAERTET